MKKYRHLLSCLLVCIVLFRFSIPAFAAGAGNNSTKSSEQLEAIMNPEEETMFSQMLAQLPSDEKALLAAGLIGEESLGRQVSVNTNSHSERVATYYYPTLNMPGAMFYIVTLGWENRNYTTTTYNGYECLKFVSTKDNIVVYVRKTAFYPDTHRDYDNSNRFPSDQIISSNVTDYLNNGNASFYYSGYWRVFNADGVRYVQLAVYGTQACKCEENEIVLQHKAITSSGSAALSGMAAPKYPTLKLEITNTGSGRRYLGGYYTKGIGADTNRSDISPLIKLGYKTAKAAAGASVSNLSFDDAAGLFDTIVSLNKSGIMGKTYISDTVPLSDVSANVYSYSCSLACPFALENNHDYVQAHIGLNGADGTSLKYQVTVSSSSAS